MVIAGSAPPPSLLLHLLFITRIRQLSIVITFFVLLLHAALDSPIVSAAPSGSMRKIGPTHALGTSEKKWHLAKPMQPVITSATTHLHRHILLLSAGAVDSPRSVEDQAVRALVGSSPPKCVKKCGACTPCKSVLVPIHTNNLPATPAEYYPEAWRCQCKGKLYNP